MDLRSYTPEKWRIVGNRILVREYDVPYGNKTILVVHSPKDGQKRGQFAGEVVVVGTGKYTKKGVLVPPSYKVGDKVIFGLYSGRRLNVTKPVWWLLEVEKTFGVVDEWPAYFGETQGRKVS